MRRDQPWEDTPYFRTSAFDVVRDPADGLFKCWYEDVQNYFAIRPGIGLTDARVCYAQSADGVHWEKPRLGIRAIDGMDTNVVLDLSPRARARTQTVILDPAEEDPSRRFKMLYVEYERHDRPPAGLRADAHSFPAQNLYGVGLCMQVSSDGVRWQPHPANPIIPYWAGDVEILTYDPIDRKYVLYGRARKWTSPPRAGFAAGDMPVWPDKPDGVWNTRRCVYRLESDDCVSWSEPVMAFEAGAGDNLDDGLYGFVPWRVDEMHLGLLNVFHQVDNVMEVYLHHGRDGRQWQPPAGAPAAHPPRPRAVRPARRRDALHADRGRRRGPDLLRGHERPPRLVDLRPWRRPGPSRGPRPGTVPRRPPPLSGDAAAGRLGVADRRGLHRNRGDQAGLLDGPLIFRSTPAAGPAGSWRSRSPTPPASRSTATIANPAVRFTGDAVRHRVRWAGRDAVNVEPRGIKLRFHLRDADLYGFRFEPG